MKSQHLKKWDTSFRFICFLLISVSSLILISCRSTKHSAFDNSISPYLVGTNVWLNPTEEIWKITLQAGLGIIRIGGGAYDRRMPSNEQLMEWIQHIKGMDAEP